MTISKRPGRPQRHTKMHLWCFPGCVNKAVSPEEGVVWVKSHRVQLFVPKGMRRRGGHQYRLLINSWILWLPKFSLGGKRGRSSPSLQGRNAHNQSCAQDQLSQATLLPFMYVQDCTAACLLQVQNNHGYFGSCPSHIFHLHTVVIVLECKGHLNDTAQFISIDFHPTLKGKSARAFLSLTGAFIMADGCGR